MSVAHHLLRLQVRIENIAENNSVPGKAGLGLDDTLAALTPAGRRQVQMLLELVKAFSEEPDERAACVTDEVLERIVLRTLRWFGRRPDDFIKDTLGQALTR